MNADDSCFLLQSKTLFDIESASTEDFSDLCDWFLQTQILRTRRISGMNELMSWLSTYGSDGFSSPDQSSNRVTGNILHCLTYGCQLGWLIDPNDRSVMIFQPQQQPDDYRV